MKDNFASHDQQELLDLGNGVSRRVLAHEPRLLLAEVAFESGAVGSAHTHPHTQLSYVLSGRFRYTIENESVYMLPGDSITVPANATHGTVCLEKGVLLDVFTPEREDFLR